MLSPVISLFRQRPDPCVSAGINPDGMDATPAGCKASCQVIKDWLPAHTGLKVSCLHIARAKAKHGIIERACCSKAKSEGGRVPKCPPEKEKAIEDVPGHFR